MSVPSSISALARQAAQLEAQLERWSEINSGSDHPAGLTRMAEVLESAWRKLTEAVTPVVLDAAGRTALVARQRPHAPIQVLCSGHYDTVYGSDSAFQHCRREGATLIGPGVADMKGGLVVMLAALTAFEGTPLAGNVGWQVVLTPDEEIGSAASRDLLEKTAAGCQLGLIFEPARENGAMVESRKGTGIFTVTCHGRAAHAGRDPGAGRNAILALAECLLTLARLPDEFPGLMLNIGRIHGGGTVNVVPDRATAELNARSATAADAAAFTDALDRLAGEINQRDGYHLEISGQFNRPPMESSPAVENLRPALSAAAIELRLSPLTWVHVGGGSDGNLLSAAGLPCLDGLGVVGGHLHSSQEYAHLPSLVERSQLAGLFLHHIATGRVLLPCRR